MHRESLLVGSRRLNRLRRVDKNLSAQGEGRSRNVQSEVRGPSGPPPMPPLNDLAGEEGHGARNPDRHIRARPHAQVLNLPSTAGSLTIPAKGAQCGAQGPALVIRVLLHDQPGQVLGQDPTFRVRPAVRHRAWGQVRRSAFNRDQVFSVPDPRENLKC